MHFVASTLAAASVLVLASAAPESFVFPDAVPLDKRQTSGPKYECHANCGFTIQDSAKEGYCKSDKWKTELSACLDCALEFDIWKWYGDKVSDAAKKCGVDATPKPAKGGESSASVTSAPETAQPETTSQATQPATTAETSAAPTQPEPIDATTVTESQPETTGAVTSAPSATHSGNSTGTAAPSTVPTAGADTIHPAGIMAGLAMLVAASFL